MKMKRCSLALMAIMVIIWIGTNGCATQGSVQNQMIELQKQVEANRAEIAMLQSSDIEQNKILSELSETVQDAVTRVQQMRETAEGKFIYETTISDDGVFFGFASSQLSEAAMVALDTFASELKKQNSNCYIEIQGHTDNLGPEEYNFQLGLARARAVMSYLHLHHNIPLNRMNTFSYGAAKPVADNGVPSERAMNRRVTLVVMS